jgi:hypothetical protein
MVIVLGESLSVGNTKDNDKPVTTNVHIPKQRIQDIHHYEVRHTG